MKKKKKATFREIMELAYAINNRYAVGVMRGLLDSIAYFKKIGRL